MSITMDSRTNYFGFRNLHNIKKEPEEMDPRKVRVKIEQEEEHQDQDSAHQQSFFKLPLHPEATDRERKIAYSHHNHQTRPNSQFQFYFQNPSSAFTSQISANSNYANSQRFKVPQHLISTSTATATSRSISNPPSNSKSKCLKTSTNMNRKNGNNSNNSNNSSANADANLHVTKRLKPGIKMDVESRPGLKRKRKNTKRQDEYDYDDDDDVEEEESILGMSSDYSSDHSSDQYTPNSNSNFSPGIKRSKSSGSNSKSSYSSSSSLPELPGPGEVKPYSCNYCTDRFYSQLGIKTHLNVQHRISASDANWHQFARKTD